MIGSQNEHINATAVEPLIRKPRLEVIEEGDNGSDMTVDQLELVRAEMTKQEFELSPKDKCQSWTILFILLMAQISN